MNAKGAQGGVCVCVWWEVVGGGVELVMPPLCPPCMKDKVELIRRREPVCCSQARGKAGRRVGGAMSEGAVAYLWSHDPTDLRPLIPLEDCCKLRVSETLRNEGGGSWNVAADKTELTHVPLRDRRAAAADGTATSSLRYHGDCLQATSQSCFFVV